MTSHYDMDQMRLTLDNLVVLSGLPWRVIWAQGGTLPVAPPTQSPDVFLADFVVETEEGLFRLGAISIEDENHVESFHFCCYQIEEIGTPQSERFFHPKRKRITSFPPAADLSPFMNEVRKRAYAIYSGTLGEDRLVGVLLETEKASLLVQCSEELPEATIGTLNPAAMRCLLAETKQISLAE